jgi:hypothetical protein
MYAADKMTRFKMSMPAKPSFNESRPIAYQIAMLMAEEIRQTRNELPNVAFEIFPRFLASAKRISPPITEPIASPISIDVIRIPPM